MNILVTGGAGFIASHIVDRYIDLGHKVSIIDNLSSGKKRNINPRAAFYQLDISSPEIEEVFKKEKPHVVNHHAAQIDVRKALEDPVFDAGINIMGSLRLLEQSVKYKVNKFIFASSGGAIYGEGDKRELPFKEDSLFRPESPYGISKLTVEKYLYAYRHTNNISYTVLRYGNVYGPRQDHTGEAGVVAIFISTMLASNPPNIYGNGEQLRDYVFVEDVVQANELALTKGEGKSFNIGTSCGRSVNEIFKYLKSFLHFSQEPIYRPRRAGEIEKVYLDTTLIRNELGWKAEYDFKKGLEKTVAFFKDRA